MRSSSRKGSVASDWGLSKLPVGKEKAELPHEETEESEKEEHMELAR
jgi:hypothetical protein